MLLLINNPKCRVVPTEREYKMDMDELLAHLEVRTNIMNEAKRVADIKARAIQAAHDAQGIEAKCVYKDCVTTARFFTSLNRWCEAHMPATPALACARQS